MRLAHLLDEPPPRKPGTGTPVLDARWFPHSCESPRRVDQGLLKLIYAPGEGPLEVARQLVSLGRGEIAVVAGGSLTYSLGGALQGWHPVDSAVPASPPPPGGGADARRPRASFAFHFFPDIHAPGIADMIDRIRYASASSFPSSAAAAPGSSRGAQPASPDVAASLPGASGEGLPPPEAVAVCVRLAGSGEALTLQADPLGAVAALKSKIRDAWGAYKKGRGGRTLLSSLFSL